MFGFLTALSQRQVAQSPIKAPAMNITLGTAGVLSLGAVLTAWKDAFEYIFGANVSNGVRAAVLIAVIAAVVVIAAVDMLARAIATRRDPHHVLTLGEGWTASVQKEGADETGFTVAAARVGDAPSEAEYLLLKDGKAPTWHRATTVTLKAPA